MKSSTVADPGLEQARANSGCSEVKRVMAAEGVAVGGGVNKGLASALPHVYGLVSSCCPTITSRQQVQVPIQGTARTASHT